jgi:hypothetical protein
MAGWPILRVLGAWFALLALAVLNGAFREAILAPRLPAATAHQASCLGIRALVRRWTPVDARESWWIGACWVALTVTFETGFGWARGASLDDLARQYAIWDGELWPLVLLWVLCAPAVCAPRGHALPGAVPPHPEQEVRHAAS